MLDSRCPIILGDFHPSNPARELMNYLLGLNPVHRNGEDMKRLFQGAPLKRPSTKIAIEEMGIDIFAECTKEPLD